MRLLRTNFIVNAARIVDVGARTSGLKALLEAVKEGRLLRKGSEFARTRILHVYRVVFEFVVFVASFFRWHGGPSKLQFSIAAFIVYFGYMLLPDFRTGAHDAHAAVVRCPNGFAYQIPEAPHTGSYVRCEDFDAYYAAMDGGRVVAAEALLLRNAAAH